MGGRRCAFSECGGTVFVDGRPDRNDGTGPADTANAAALADFTACGIAVKTDGAFRLERDGDKALVLTPIPDIGRPFRVELNIGKIAGAVPIVSAVEPVESSSDAARPDWKLTDGILTLSVDSKSFAYRVVMR